MPVYGRFEIDITTATQEEMDRISAAIFNGYAEHVLKERLLWSEYSTPSAPASRSGRKTKATPHEPEPEAVDKAPLPPLQRIDTHASAPKAIVQQAKPERTAGIIGRGRMGRSAK